MRAARVSPRLRTLLITLCLTFIAAVASCAPRASVPSSAGPPTPAFGPILQQAEGLFRNMKARDYPAVWGLLSAKSRETIVGDVVRESGRLVAGTVDPGEISKDFEQGGAIARVYWESYLGEFDPDTVLLVSRWEMGKVEGDLAEIRITYGRSERPAVLRMVREGEVWKAGLIETFRPRPLP